MLPVLIHGDAAFAGQGVVAETLNLSELPGYDVGGTVHIVVNNQLGFTTAPDFARSTVYATDIAKAVQAPVFHVNGDDPEAACRVIQLAFAFRQRFAKDVVVDMVCYRRYGHNEGDEPAFTQPRMYELIDARRSVRKLYTETLVNRGDLTLPELRRRSRTTAPVSKPRSPQPMRQHRPARVGPSETAARSHRRRFATAVPLDRLQQIMVALSTYPETFTVHPKLERILAQRAKAFAAGHVDWALARGAAPVRVPCGEATPVRVAGQDTRRGTFSQRHAVLVDFNDEHEYTPLAHMPALTTDAPRAVHDLRLGAVGVRGARLRIRLLRRRSRHARVLGSAVRRLRQRWADDHRPVHRRRRRQVGTDERAGAPPPHGFEGQGPSTRARGSNASSPCAPTTTCASPTRARRRSTSTCCAARCSRRDDGRSSCSHRSATSACPPRPRPVAELTDGGFRTTIVDDGGADPADHADHRVHGEDRSRADRPARRARCDRGDRAERAALPGADRGVHSHRGAVRVGAEIVWVQEEPENMGARLFAMPLLHGLARPGVEVSWVARDFGCPATGSSKVHDAEQQKLLDAAFGPLLEPVPIG